MFLDQSACNAGDLGLIPGTGRSPEEGNANPVHYSCLEKSRQDGGAWRTPTMRSKRVGHDWATNTLTRKAKKQNKTKHIVKMPPLSCTSVSSVLLRWMFADLVANQSFILLLFWIELALCHMSWFRKFSSWQSACLKTRPWERSFHIKMQFMLFLIQEENRAHAPTSDSR